MMPSCPVNRRNLLPGGQVPKPDILELAYSQKLAIRRKSRVRTPIFIDFDQFRQFSAADTVPEAHRAIPIAADQPSPVAEELDRSDKLIGSAQDHTGLPAFQVPQADGLITVSAGRGQGLTVRR